MNDLTEEQIKSMTYEEFDKTMRRVHAPRKHKVTKTLLMHDIMRPVRKSKAKYKPYGDDILERVLSRLFLLLRDRVIYDGYLLVFPYNMGFIYVKDYEDICYKFKEKHKVIDWQKSMHKWHEDGNIGKVYKNMVLSQQKAYFTYKGQVNSNIRKYYRFKFMRSFRQEMKIAQSKNKLKCYE